MELAILLFLITAVVLAVLCGFGVGGRRHLGWLAVACLITGVWLLPALAAF
jgi:hypothetical protein